MKHMNCLALILTLLMGSVAIAAEDNVMNELVPTGRLRVGVAYAPASTPVFVVRDAAGGVHGIPSDIGNALAKVLGVPIEIIAAATTAELTEAVAAGMLDIAFMPADDERRKRFDFSPPYFVIESTFLAAGSSDIKTLGDVDRPE
jgi:polar amino acid transport system substrate-binding protein